MTQPASPPQPPAPSYVPPQGPSGPRASFGRRLAASLVDGLIYGVAFWILVLVAGSISDAVLVIVYIIAFIAGLVYYGWFEGSPSGQTPGKKLLGIRVVDFNTGGPIGFGRGIVRWVARILSSLPCYLGYLWMLWDREKQTWHDKLATCVVVPESAYPVEKWPG